MTPVPFASLALAAALLLPVGFFQVQGKGKGGSKKGRAEQAWSAQRGLPAALKRDVVAGNQEWIDGFKAGDADRMVASYSQEGVFCNAAGDCVKGRAAIAGLYKDALAKFGRASDASVRSEALRVDGDLAFESGSATMRFAGGERQGRFSTVWKLEPDGHWRIFRNLSLAPAPEKTQTR